VKVLFLDIDGVLNDHAKHPNGYCGLQSDKLLWLDVIVRETGCKLVLASAWRYMILGGRMTLTGFEYLLLTHGAAKETAASLLAFLPADKDPDDFHDRGKLARRWLDSAGRVLGVTQAVALDDGINGMDFGYTANGIPPVCPKSWLGLTEADAREAIRLLNNVPEVTA
jgi:hypothetical protein